VVITANKDRAGLHMSFNNHDRVSHLFLVRIRAGDTARDPQPEQTLWCGRVQRVVSGEACDFRDWCELIECLSAMLAGSPAPPENEA
jgi:hypothetical protein